VDLSPGVKLSENGLAGFPLVPSPKKKERLAFFYQYAGFILIRGCCSSEGKQAAETIEHQLLDHF